MARKRRSRDGDPPDDSAPKFCQIDGFKLDDQGFCLEGNGYSVDLRCPFGCPNCRRFLEWSGGCLGCHGSPTPFDRATWIFPGDRYETHTEQGHPIGDGQHWVLQARGPRAACPPAQNADEAKMLARVLKALDLRGRSVGRPVESGRL